MKKHLDATDPEQKSILENKYNEATQYGDKKPIEPLGLDSIVKCVEAVEKRGHKSRVIITAQKAAFASNIMRHPWLVQSLIHNKAHKSR